MNFTLPSNVPVDQSPDQARDILNMVMTSDVNDYYIAIGTRPFTRRQGFFSEVREAPIIDQDKMDAILSFLLKGSLDNAKAAIANKEAFHFSGTLSSTLDGINRECRYRAILVNTLTGPELTVRVLDRNLLALDQIGLQSSHYEQLVATLQRKGLILVTGPTGAGKSTTLAAMIQCIIDSKQSRVVTLEDPIEFIYKASVRENYTAYSMVSQRTVGVDTATVEAGIKDALRQKPDLIMIGEIRGDETMKAVLQNVETGHLMIGTMHAATVYQALNRLMHCGMDANVIRQTLGNNLLCVIAQDLLPTADSTEEEPHRVLCYEALFCPDRKSNTKFRQTFYGSDTLTMEKMAELIEEGHGATWNKCLETLIENGKLNPEAVMDKQ